MAVHNWLDLGSLAACTFTRPWTTHPLTLDGGDYDNVQTGVPLRFSMVKTSSIMESVGLPEPPRGRRPTTYLSRMTTRSDRGAYLQIARRRKRLQYDEHLAWKLPPTVNLPPDLHNLG